MIRFKTIDSRESQYVSDLKDFIIKKQKMIRTYKFFGLTVYKREVDYTDDFDSGGGKGLGFK